LLRVLTSLLSILPIVADGAEHLIPTEMVSLVKRNRDLPNLLGTSQQK